MDYILLGKRIKEERLKLNLTQENLAEKINVSTSYIGQIERGERSLSLDTLVNICNVLGVTVDYLLKDSINISKLDSCNYTNELNQILHDKTTKEKMMAINVIKLIFSYLK